MLRLPENQFHRFEHVLAHVPVNTLFAQSVLRRKVSGSVYVDCIDAPAVFYITHPYGMSLLYGTPDNAAFNACLCQYIQGTPQHRNGDEWLQTYPREWDAVLSALFPANTGPIETHCRVNFAFNPQRYSPTYTLPAGMTLRPATKTSYGAMAGSVVPARFWDNADDFAANAIGVDIVHQDQVVTQAFSSFLLDGKLELGMETLPSHRGKGLAEAACRHLIALCLTRELE
ncbi:MAG: GNAT family N-acetyltransferase, partial [Paludibacterium sp.]